jgi:hypothetical protein
VKKQARRLVLNRETLLQLTNPALVQLPNGQGFQQADRLPYSADACTSPLCMDTYCRCDPGTVVVIGAGKV